MNQVPRPRPVIVTVQSVGIINLHRRPWHKCQLTWSFDFFGELGSQFVSLTLLTQFLLRGPDTLHVLLIFHQIKHDFSCGFTGYEVVLRFYIALITPKIWRIPCVSLCFKHWPYFCVFDSRPVRFVLVGAFQAIQNTLSNLIDNFIFVLIRMTLCSEWLHFLAEEGFRLIVILNLPVPADNVEIEASFQSAGDKASLVAHEVAFLLSELDSDVVLLQRRPLHRRPLQPIRSFWPYLPLPGWNQRGWWFRCWAILMLLIQWFHFQCFKKLVCFF